MRSYSRKRKNNIIIGTLCGVMLLMVVGYAAFASQLNIKGTSGISSNWDIEITNIRGGNPYGGDAYDVSEPTYTPTTATFSTGLKTPVEFSDNGPKGSYRMYEVEVTNKGTLTGLVTIANLSCGDNDAIGCQVMALGERWFDDEWVNLIQSEPEKWTDINEGQQDYSDIAFTLAPGEKHYIYVGIMYKNVTSQPENLSANINLELTYEQDGLDENGINQPVVPLPDNGIVYSLGKTTININDPLKSIQKATTDYQKLNKIFFLKHNIADSLVQSNEVCFIKDNVLHCLKPNEYETSKATLLNIFGESVCDVREYFVDCGDASLSVQADEDGDVYVSSRGNTNLRGATGSYCDVYANGSAECDYLD